MYLKVGRQRWQRGVERNAAAQTSCMRMSGLSMQCTSSCTRQKTSALGLGAGWSTLTCSAAGAAALHPADAHRIWPSALPMMGAICMHLAIEPEHARRGSANMQEQSMRAPTARAVLRVPVMDLLVESVAM